MRQVAIIGVFVLALSMDQASATCAWVLWSVQDESTDIDIPMPKMHWRQLSEPIYPYNTRTECETAARLHIQLVQSPAYAQEHDYTFQENLPNGALFTVGDKKVVQEKYMCWPDTIDPRRR